MTQARIIDGKAFALNLRTRIAGQVATLKEAHGLEPGLAVVLVGDDPASQVYVRNKGQATLAAGMRSFEHKLPDTVDQATLVALVERLNRDPAVNGILVQLPLPPPDRPRRGDRDDRSGQGCRWLPCRERRPAGAGASRHGALHAAGLHDASARYDRRPEGVEGAGARPLLHRRRPMASLLLAADCTVTIAHSRTQDLAGECRRADILVAAVGRPEMVRGDWIKPGATVIDVGINRVAGAVEGKTRLVGDVNFAEAVEVAGAITPVPGGVGPMTIACLLLNTLTATCRQNGIPAPDETAA